MGTILDLGIGEEPDVASSGVLVRAISSAILVVLGGVFAGLTIGLMGQDEVFLQVTAETGDEFERKHAKRVLKLLAKGKHWVLVTLLLSNVITNETLPIVLDRLLGGGWPAVVSSTAAIVIFGEIIPQSICVRYGLPLGAFFAPFVQCLMYLMYPLAVPIAKLLDTVLGEDHGTIYKKAGLKSLVTLHHHMGIERLNEDEVTIISAVLDLKDKPISHIMTPIKDVFVLSSDTVLDEAMVEKILLTGFNRIPIHVPNENLNFIGMLLVRTLITYDPDDALPISSFALATLPETAPDTSCLNILNYFQEGKAHMVAVSNDPGAVTGAVGVVTLEDVIEELIGEEIVDETDVFVDVQRAIRRVSPAPMLRSTKQAVSKANQIVSQQKVSALRPSNRASDPKETSNSKIKIKRTAKSSSPSQEAYLSTSNAPLPSHMQPYRDEESPASLVLGHSYANVSDMSFSKQARSPGNIVTKPSFTTVDGEFVNVAETEREALSQNFGSDGLNKSPLARHASRSPVTFQSALKLKSQPRLSQTSIEDEDTRSATFSENVIHVNGVNKVIIQEISSSDDEAGSSSEMNISHKKQQK